MHYRRSIKIALIFEYENQCKRTLLIKISMNTKVQFSSENQRALLLLKHLKFVN